MKTGTLALFIVHLILTILLPSDVQAQIGRNLYVSEEGSDLNQGDSVRRPLRTLQKAADMATAGKTVWVMNGVYTTPGPGDTVMYVTNSGTPAAWIRFKAYPGHKPIIRVQQNWGGITIAGASYVEINGIEIEGNRKKVRLKYALAQSENLNNPVTSGNGISVTSEDGKLPHHVFIRNCHVHDCCGGGIATENADYVRIENNLVHNNAYFSPYSQSGISMYLNANTDDFTGVKMIVRNNICYGNRNYVPSYYSGATPQERVIADGNGIIIDDTRNIQNATLTLPYLGKTLVDRNIVYDNGGRGILVYLSDNVRITNNSSFDNARHPSLLSDMLINKSSGVILRSNSIMPGEGRVDLEVRDSVAVQIFE